MVTPSTRVTVLNRADRARRVRISLPANDYGSGYGMPGLHIASLSRTFDVPAAAPGSSGTARTVSLLQPPVPIRGGGMTVSIDGRQMREPVPMDVIEHGGSDNRYGYSHPSVVEDLPYAKNVLRSPEVRRKQIDDRYGGSGLTSAPFEEWPTTWLGYSRYAAVDIMADEWRDLPSDVRDAVLAYVDGRRWAADPRFGRRRSRRGAGTERRG